MLLTEQDIIWCRKKVQDVPYPCIELLDEYQVNANKLELAYLKSLDADRLLAGFREVAGLPAKADKYAGGELLELQGHTLGHYLTAIAQTYAAGRHDEWGSKIEYILKELKLCQAADGYLFASDVEIFDRIEKKIEAWVPWYTLHKILSGVAAAYEATKSREAYEIMTKLGEWVWNSIIFIAALSSVDTQLYDACKIDGANRWQTMIHIDFPAILPTIIIILILNMGNILNVGFDKVFLMQNSLNMGASQVISTYVYTVGIKSTQFSFGAAVGLFNTLVNFIFLIATNSIAKRVTGTGLM